MDKCPPPFLLGTRTKARSQRAIPELIDAIVETKRRNPSWGCLRIAQQVTPAFGVSLAKDIVRRVLAKHFMTKPGSSGPSWLTLLGHMKDSFRSLDLFRCESLTLRSHWILDVMDQYSRTIIGFGVHAGTVNGIALRNELLLRV
jgi:putative transposase